MKKILSIFLIFITFLIIFSTNTLAYEFSQKSTDYNLEQVYNTFAEDCLDFEKDAKYFFPYKVDNFDVDKIIEKVVEKNKLIGYSLYSVTGNVEKTQTGTTISLYFKYYINKTEYKAVQSVAHKFANEMSGYTDYEKIKTIHDYLIENCSYQVGSNGPYKTLFKNVGNCNGYALAFFSIMDACGIECTYETGSNHAWNAVKLDGEWYNIDVTWDDTGVWDKEGGITYDYFLKNDADWRKHHHGSSTAKTSYPADLTIDKPIKNIILQQKFLMFSPFIIIFAITIILLPIISIMKKKRKQELFSKYNNSTAYFSQQTTISDFDNKTNNNDSHIINF